MNDFDILPPNGRMRRALIGAGLLAATPARRLFAQTAAHTSPHLSVSEPPAFYSDSSSVIAKRFALYQAAGIGTLRCSVHWDDMEYASGQWRLPKNLAYLQQAYRSGFALKLVLSTMGTIPPWFVQQYPDSQIRDQSGATTHLSMSYWYPNLAEVPSNALTGMCSMLAGQNILLPANFFIIDLGAAAEPKYPMAWNVGLPSSDVLFWCYDSHAVSNFASAMQAIYGTIASANAAWKTSYSSWSAVTPPKPGSSTGPIWNDFLTWYRNSKRSFITAQVNNYQSVLKNYSIPSPRLVTLVTGSHITDQEWAQAITGQNEAANIGAMIDTPFVLDAAAKAGCSAQFTGAQSGSELTYIRDYMSQKSYTYSLWGENAMLNGPTTSGNTPADLCTNVTNYKLYGPEYIDASYLFESDHVTPTSWYSNLKTAYLGLLPNMPAS